MKKIIIRLIDFMASLIGIVFLGPLFLFVILILIFDTGSPIFIQKRMGKNKKCFRLIKFRTMSIGTKSVATHLSKRDSVTRVGKILRRTKIDELPQLINVLAGDMSFVGPRPNLFNQDILIKERDSRGVYSVKPGITGLSQIKKLICLNQNYSLLLTLG